MRYPSKQCKNPDPEHRAHLWYRDPTFWNRRCWHHCSGGRKYVESQWEKFQAEIAPYRA